MFNPVKDDSILGKANAKGILDVNLINIRDFSTDKHNKTDDTPFGGGVGMVMFCQPIFDAIKSIYPEYEKEEKKPKMIYMSPRGRVLNQEKIEELSKMDELTILCGHYEGVDQRVLDYYDMEEISIGDYILTGGELPAMVLIDSVSRFIPGVLGDSESAIDESIYSGLLEADQYTKPREYDGMGAPEVLFSGNHHAIELWQLKRSLEITANNKPELLEKWLKNKEEKLKDYTKRERMEINHFIEKLLSK